MNEYAKFGSLEIKRNGFHSISSILMFLPTFILFYFIESESNIIG